jgi:hypothetical protein
MKSPIAAAVYFHKQKPKSKLPPVEDLMQAKQNFFKQKSHSVQPQHLKSEVV